jgi:radical SAM superfamily enzyme YgiQ (UPF0313 family)
MKELYKGQKYLRWRTVPHFISELVEMRRTAPYMNFIYICDDLFLARRLDELREFSEEYRNKIQLPFMCCTDPVSISDEKMDLLVGAGMIGIQMGVESGSSAIQALFNRKGMTNERMLRSMKTIHGYRKNVIPYYDLIVDTPYETDRDKIETIKFISQMPKPYRLGIYALVLLPGTRLYEKAMADGMIKDEIKEVYEKHFFIRQPNFLNLLILLVQNIPLPGWALRLLVHPAVIFVLNGRAMKSIVKRIYIAAKSLHGRFIAPKQNPSVEFLKSHYN